MITALLLLILIFALSFRNEEGFADMANACRKQHTVKWESQVTPEFNVDKNPFAKDCGHHCRSDTNCKSGKCNGWYCVNE